MPSLLPTCWDRSVRRPPRRDVLIAVGSAIGGVVLYAAGATGVPLNGATGSPWLLATLAVLCVAALFRSTYPTPAIVVSTAAFTVDMALGGSLAAICIFSDALYAATVYGHRLIGRWLLGITVVLSLVAGIAVLVASRDVRALILVTAVIALILVTPILTGVTVRQHRDQVRIERQRAEQMATLAEYERQRAVTAERSQMARELHDLVANHLSAIALRSSAALSIEDPTGSATRESLTVIRQSSVEGLAEMRRMIGLLRATDSEGDERVSAIPRLDEVDQLVDRARGGGLTVDLTVTGHQRRLPAAVDLAGYRIVQESLTNALKHADADGPTTVLLDFGDNKIAITVDSALSTQANPESAVPGTGSGLVGMRERAALLDGTLRVGLSAGRWRVHAELPTGEDDR